MTTQQLIKTPEAAKYLCLAVGTLTKDRSTNELKIPYLKLGRAVVYDIAELAKWVALQSVNTKNAIK